MTAAATMPVIFAGATTVGADWPWAATAVFGTATGLAAGVVLGLATGIFLVTLDGPAIHRDESPGVPGTAPVGASPPAP